MQGMAAHFSGVVQSPITGAVLVLEMTGNLGMTMAVAAASMLGRRFLTSWVGSRFLPRWPASF